VPEGGRRQVRSDARTRALDIGESDRPGAHGRRE
jgi:hypothetical protein